MRLLIWHWGRFGAGPRYAAALAEAWRGAPGIEPLLSLSEHAEILAGPAAPPCDLPVPTYGSLPGFAWRAATAPFRVRALAGRLRALGIEAALCAMPGMLDLMMLAALRRAGVPVAVVVHDADAHPGDGFPLQMRLQRALVRRADVLAALSGHVAARLAAQGLADGKPLVTTVLPPFDFGAIPPPRAHAGRLRLLSFGRLLPYKGLDLLLDGLRLLGPRADMEVRVVGQGPESETLAALRALPNVRVENRWVPEAEVGTLLAWSDALVLSHREASQSGVAATAIAARRYVVATRVGGLVEQLRDEPLALLCDPAPKDLAAALARLPEHARTAASRAHDPHAAWRQNAAAFATALQAAFAARRGGGAGPEAAAAARRDHAG